MHRFRITVEALTPGSEDTTLQFETENHDDIIAIANRMNGRFGLEEEPSKAFAVGLKLLGEILLKHRKEEPFQSLRPAYSDFIKAVKAAR